MTLRTRCVLIAVLTSFVATSVPDSAPAKRKFLPHQLLVRFEPHVKADKRRKIRAEVGAKVADRLPVDNLQLVTLPNDISVKGADRKLEREDGVRYAEPNFLFRLAAVPNDPLFGRLWGLSNPADNDIDAPEAWDSATGSRSTRLAIADSGIDIRHADLRPNLYVHPGETRAGRESNGVDDDGNGFVDDARGWDFWNADNNPLDDNGHGSHVSGTVAGVGGNGIGVVGVNWRASLMPLKVCDQRGECASSAMVDAFVYANRSGARVVNVSIGGRKESRAVRNAITSARRTLFVVAAGNDASDNDTSPVYPCNYSNANLICVAASDRDDRLAGFTNYGARSVDLAAPGVDILSPLPGGLFGTKSGTSMAAPHVTGVAGLLFSRRPGASPTEVRKAILAGVDPLSESGPGSVNPSEVRVGQRVTFAGDGFNPGEPVTVTLVPVENVGGNCCGAKVGTFTARTGGQVSATFEWPSTYRRCGGAGNCHSYPWPPGEPVAVFLCGARCVRIDTRVRPGTSTRPEVATGGRLNAFKALAAAATP
jgi:subtilisin family serine protease